MARLARWVDRLLAALALAVVGVVLGLGAAFLAVYLEGGEPGALAVALLFLSAGLLALLCSISDRCPPLAY